LIATLAAMSALVAVPAMSGIASADGAGDERAFVDRLNAVRAAKGLPALMVDVRVIDVARSWSATMAGANRLYHNPSLAAQMPNEWEKIGENVGYGGSVAAVADAFVASPDHYRNIVDPAFNAVGVGVVWSGTRLWVTQNFMKAPSGSIAGAKSNLPGWYRLAGGSGEVYSFGSASPLPNVASPAPVVGIASTKSGAGYWTVAANGAVFAFGDARFHGSMAGAGLNSPIVGMAATPDGGGYWLLGRDGGIFSFGNARFFGSTGSVRLNQPVVGMTASPSGNGYWFVAADGGIFAFGDARFQGSTGSIKLNQPVVGMAATPTGSGYWLVARDGGIFAFGDAKFQGSTGGIRLNQPVVGMAPTPTNNGYWFVAADGGIFGFGDASFLGSAGGRALPAPVTGMVGGL
jgi:hypothetical protein